jgi:PAS domain S-box-containing protein
MSSSHDKPSDLGGAPSTPALDPAVLTTDRDGVITSCDRAAERLLRCRAEDAVGRSLLTFYDPVEVVARAAKLGIPAGWEVVAGGARCDAPEAQEWTCVRPGGERVRTTQTVMAMRAAGRDAGFVCVARVASPAHRPAGARRGTSAELLAVFDASPVATVITRAVDGRIFFANHACLEMLGWLDGGFVGRSTLEVGLWSRSDRRKGMLETLARDGFVRDMEQEVRTRAGETKIVLASVSSLVFDDQPSLIGHIHDITQRRRLEQQLRESEERFRQVTEIYQQGFVLSDIDPPCVLYASPAVARIFGIDLETLYRDPLALQRLVHPDDHADLLARRSTMTDATDLEYRVVRPDGRTRWIRTRAQPVTMKDGKVERVAGVSEDVTAERELRESLREREELFRLLAENSTDVIGRLGADQRIEYVSPASRSVYGYEPEAMVGRFGWEFIHPEDVAVMREDFSAHAGSEVVTNTYRVIRGDGTYVYVEAKIRALYHPVSGELVEFHTVARDVGERRQAEGDVRRAKEEAELANAAKSEFLSRMSHELRTPLHSILGFGELLARGDLRAQQSEQLTQITRAGQHLLELINEVLDLSRIEGGELHISLEPVHIGQVVMEALDMLGPSAATHAVSLVPPPEGLDIHVLADRQRLKQALLNLLSNAVKYNRDGGEVRVVATRHDPASVRIEVTDTGIGIAADDLARAFAAFERLGAETTDVEGTGLGLALARRLIEAMGGTIGVDSEVGRGSTFWLDLPEVVAPAARPPPAQRAPAAPAPVRTDARTVLYIEDNPSNIKLVETILRERPEVTLLVAQQGRLGIELAREHMPALVLLDLNLPDLSGEEVLRRLRGDPRTAGIAVVMVSADATSGQLARRRSPGAEGYLTKPFQIEQLLAVIDAPAAERGFEAGAGLAAPPPAPAGEPPADRPLDPSMLDRLRSMYPDGAAVDELVEIYLKDSPVRLEALAAAAAAGDAEAVRSAAHGWRGSCGVTGAHRLVALLDDIETLARVGAVPDEQQLAEVRHAFGEARAALVAQRG